MKNLVYLKDVTTLKLDDDKCIGCGLCLIVCPHEVFELSSCKAAVINKDACMECGACQMNCPAGAINVDVGVGCAAGILNSMLGRDGDSCCCVNEPKKNP